MHFLNTQPLFPLFTVDGFCYDEEKECGKQDTKEEVGLSTHMCIHTHTHLGKGRGSSQRYY